MSDLAKLGIWDDPAILNALSWYLDVAENRRPAKFRIAATVAAGLDPIGANISRPCIGTCVFFAQARADDGTEPRGGFAGKRRSARA
jgi:hypothetical protein